MCRLLFIIDSGGLFTTLCVDSAVYHRVSGLFTTLCVDSVHLEFDRLVTVFQNIVFLGRKSKTLNLYTTKTKLSSFYYNHNMLNICFYGKKGTMVYHM